MWNIEVGLKIANQDPETILQVKVSSVFLGPTQKKKSNQELNYIKLLE